MMRLGTQTGSLTNHLLSRMVGDQPVPTVGMGATILAWTDRHAATIIAVDGERVTVQEDIAKRADKNGMSESQAYTFEPNQTGRVVMFRRRANGMWQEVRKNETTGRWNKVDGYGLRIGDREEYYDFSF